jgi:glycosyltransferase involved in cell wall biosynthesis
VPTTSTPLRIAVVAPNQHLIGGAETYLRWVLATLVERGHTLGFAFEAPTSDGARAVDRRTGALERWSLRDLGRQAFAAELARFAPDVVFLQGAHDETLDLELASRYPAVLFAHGFYGTCVTGARVHRIPQRQICNRRMGMACLPVNFLRGCGGRDPIRLSKLYVRELRCESVLSSLKGLVVASHFMRGVFLEHGVPGSRIHIISPPPELAVDAELSAARSSRSRVLFLGRLTSLKGGADAIQAVALAERELGWPLHLTVAGEGPELESCRRLARQKGILAQFPGWVDGEQRLRLLRESDLLILPSLWPEPFGMVGIEAACVGLPAVAYRTGGIVDWLRPGETGELAAGPGFDPAALAAALVRALRAPDHYQKLRLGAWRMAHEFGGAQHVARLEDLFQRVVAQSR